MWVVLVGTLEIVEATAKNILPVDLSTVQAIGNWHSQVGKGESLEIRNDRPGIDRSWQRICKGPRGKCVVYTPAGFSSKPRGF